MKFKLEINCDNDAFTGEFGDERNTEVSDILSRLAFVLVSSDGDGLPGAVLRDSNGNVVGSWEFTNEEESE